MTGGFVGNAVKSIALSDDDVDVGTKVVDVGGVGDELGDGLLKGKLTWTFETILDSPRRARASCELG